MRKEEFKDFVELVQRFKDEGSLKGIYLEEFENADELKRVSKLAKTSCMHIILGDISDYNKSSDIIMGESTAENNFVWSIIRTALVMGYCGVYSDINLDVIKDYDVKESWVKLI